MTPAPVTRRLLDTSVVLDYRAGNPAPVAFFAAIRASRLPEFSQITAMVLLAQSQDAADLLGVRTLLRISTVHSLTASIARRAQAILDSLAPACPLAADDAVVAATAVEHKLSLYTLDPARFAHVAGLSVLQPY